MNYACQEVQDENVKKVIQYCEHYLNIKYQDILDLAKTLFQDKRWAIVVLLDEISMHKFIINIHLQSYTHIYNVNKNFKHMSTIRLSFDNCDHQNNQTVCIYHIFEKNKIKDTLICICRSLHNGVDHCDGCKEIREDPIKFNDIFPLVRVDYEPYRIQANFIDYYCNGCYQRIKGLHQKETTIHCPYCTWGMFCNIECYFKGKGVHKCQYLKDNKSIIFDDVE